MSEYTAVKITATLKKWWLKNNAAGCYVWGEIHGDTKKRFSDGRMIHTSQMTGYDVNRDGIIFQTLNSTYWLPYADINDGEDITKVQKVLPVLLERAKILLDNPFRVS